MRLFRASPCPPSASCPASRPAGPLALGFLAFALALGATQIVEAKPRKAKAQTRASAKGKSASKEISRGPARTASEESALADAKVAVLPFEGEDTETLRKHVIKLLVERGLQVDSTLKPQDNAVQYRDMGTVLNLAVYVHGKIKSTSAEHAVATVTIRSAVTGRPVATASFNGFRRGLPFDVEEKLWDRVGPAFKRACVEATRPGARRKGNFQRIEAGTPL